MQPHALLLPYPATGHINPLMQLAVHLATNGILVTFVNTRYNNQRILQSNAGRLPFDLGLPIRLLDIPDGLSELDNRDNDVHNFTQIIANVGSPLEDLIDKISSSGERITCIISDFVAVQTVDVAHKLRIPRVAFWSSNGPVYSCCSHAVHRASEGTFPTNGVVQRDEFISFPGSPSLPGWKLPWMIGDYVVTEGVFKSALEGLQLCLHPNWILSNSVHELDFGAVGAMPPQFSRPLPIGPILPIDVLQMPSTNKISCRASLWHEEDSCLQWLDEQKPQSVLYVSLGSIAILDKEQLKELAVALEASELPILWVLRDDLTGSKGTFLPDDFQDRTRKMIRIISWSPQLLVLAHKAVGGFLTHAGWNSTLEALSMGVPMLVWPHLGDQFLNAELVVGEWGVGLELNLGNKDFIGKNCIESQVRKLMEEHEGEVLRAKAKEIRQQILTAVAEGGSSYNNLQSFVTWVKRQAQIL